MDVGIIKCFKAKYQKKYIQHILDQFERGLDIQNPENKLNIKEAINYVAASWDEVDELTMANCWMKTGILLLVSYTDIELAQNMYLESIELEEDKIYTLVVDLIEDLDSTVVQEIEAYRKINNIHISTEETLDDTQIVETVLAKQLEYKQGDSDDSDEEPPKVSPSEGLIGLKSFTLFAEQQICNNFFFNNNDLKVFSNQSMAINDDFHDDDNSFSGDDFSGSDNFSGSDDFSNDNGNDDFFDDNDFLDNNNLFYYDGLSDNYDSSPDNYEN
ncbi:6368_t:CDS:2 [Scutellospora calospora]|uniref:6368_t:CDS:1 n=1 Tax=Scutellospora calospora TaxID=85575 RepID=A0ACA9L347_9GLOM|nr:6368_t:CDS:2 [Scutellospora calospora]